MLYSNMAYFMAVRIDRRLWNDTNNLDNILDASSGLAVYIKALSLKGRSILYFSVIPINIGLPCRERDPSLLLR